MKAKKKKNKIIAGVVVVCAVAVVGFFGVRMFAGNSKAAADDGTTVSSADSTS